MNFQRRPETYDLLREPIQSHELASLLERLAFDDEFFSEPLPTIRDVAEATDASPVVIARILSQMRDPDEVTLLRARMESFDARLRHLESQRHANTSSPEIQFIEVRKPVSRVDLNDLFGNQSDPPKEQTPSWSKQKELIMLSSPREVINSQLSWHDNDPLHRFGRWFVGIIVALTVLLLFNSSCTQ